MIAAVASLERSSTSTSSKPVVLCAARESSRRGNAACSFMAATTTDTGGDPEAGPERVPARSPAGCAERRSWRRARSTPTASAPWVSSIETQSASTAHCSAPARVMAARAPASG